MQENRMYADLLIGLAHPTPSSTSGQPPCSSMRINHLGHVGRRELASRALLATAALVGGPAWAAGPSSLSGKPRPETGVVLIEPVVQTGKTVSAELLVPGSETSLAVIAAFDSSYAVAKGNYYDCEARSKDGDSAFLHVASLPPGQRLEDAPASFFTGAALGANGRFGSYSAPQITSMVGGQMGGETPKGLSTAPRTFDVSFNALTQGGFEVPRRGVIAAVQPAGSSAVLMLVSTVGAARWKKGGEADARAAASSFRVTQVRPSQLQPGTDSDYRYASRSIRGVRGSSEADSEIDAALARDLSTQSGALTGKFAGGSVAGYVYQNAQGP